MADTAAGPMLCAQLLTGSNQSRSLFGPATDLVRDFESGGRKIKAEAFTELAAQSKSSSAGHPKVLSCKAVPYACAAMLTAIATRSDPETVPATYQDRAGDTGQPAPVTGQGEECMAIGVIFNFPGGTTEQYDQVCRGLNNGRPMRSLADWPGGGCLSHTAGLRLTVCACSTSGSQPRSSRRSASS